MDVRDRITQFIAYKRMSKRRFQASIGVSSSYIQGITSGMSADVLHKISSTYPDLNTDWLLTGEGEMLKTTQSVGDISNSNVSGVNVNGKEIHISSMEAYSTLLKIVESNLKTTEKFQEQIDRLIGVIEHKYEAEQK